MSLTHVEPRVFEQDGRWYMEGYDKDVAGKRKEVSKGATIWARNGEAGKEDLGL